MATKSRVNIKTYNDNYINTNGNGDISGKDVHDIYEDIADSMLMAEDVINDDTTGGADRPVSAEVAKTHGTEIDSLTTQSNTNTSEIARVESDLKDDINGIDNAVDKNTADIATNKQDIVSNTQAFADLIKEYGSLGRVRFDESNKHFYFEVKDGTAWIIKAEIGKSIIVDALRLIKGENPTNIIPGEIALYNKEITLPDGSKSVRSHFVLEDGTEYGFVVNNQQTDEVVFRKDSGELIHIPIIYSDENNDYTDIQKIKFVGSVSVAKDATDSKKLIVNVKGKGDEQGDTPGTLYESDLNEDQFERDLGTNKIQLKESIEGLDLTGFTVFKQNVVVVIPFSTGDTFTSFLLPLDIPADVQVSVLSIYKQNPKTQFIEEITPNYLYDPQSKEIAFAMGARNLVGNITMLFMK